MRFREMIVSALVFVVISGVFAFAADTGSAIAPSPRMLDGLSPEAAMDLANTWGMSSDENKVSIWTTSREIHFVFPDGSKRIVALPPDRMVVSVAPYIMKTHPCKQHTPSGCQGELPNTPVEVRAVTADGKVILEEKTKTLPNGFVDLWLPRNLHVEVTLKARGLTATQRIRTFDSDRTCITETRLHPGST